MTVTEAPAFTAAQVEAAKLTLTLDELDHKASPTWVRAVADGDAHSYQVAVNQSKARAVLRVDAGLAGRDDFPTDDDYVAYLLQAQNLPVEQRPEAERAIRRYLRTAAA